MGASGRRLLLSAGSLYLVWCMGRGSLSGHMLALVCLLLVSAVLLELVGQPLPLLLPDDFRRRLLGSGKGRARAMSDRST